MGYKHKTVNHFRGCSTAEGVHTNHVESLWRGAKRKWNPWMEQGVPFLQSFLDEWLWRRQRSKDH